MRETYSAALEIHRKAFAVASDDVLQCLSPANRLLIIKGRLEVRCHALVNHRNGRKADLTAEVSVMCGQAGQQIGD